uniref:Stf0 family sulfotransferase n=1 Tax=uncultured Sphingomonas sp. TaxID=158754 RepID=UPI0035CA14BD
MRGYVMMTYARCGGTWLSQLLGSVGTLGRPEDWFNGQGYRDRGIADYPLDHAGQRAAMLSLGRTPNGVFGVKLSPLRFDDLAGYDWSEGLGDFAFVHLVRRDRLARALSDAKARQTRQYRSTSPVRGIAHYDAAMIDHALRTQADDEGRAQRYFAANGIVPLEIAYEDLLARTELEIRRIADHLGEHGPVRLDYGKIDLRIQSDALNAAWRERFVAERGRLAHMDSPTRAPWRALARRVRGWAVRGG